MYLDRVDHRVDGRYVESYVAERNSSSRKKQSAEYERKKGRQAGLIGEKTRPNRHGVSGFLGSSKLSLGAVEARDARVPESIRRGNEHKVPGPGSLLFSLLCFSRLSGILRRFPSPV